MSKTVQCCFKRYEKKYLLTPAQYTAMLDGMSAYMRPDEFGSYTICNIYYDTDDFQLIRTSLEKPIYKEKLRMRSYGVPTDEGKVFVELKKKYDGVVYKRRVVMQAEEAVEYLDGEARPAQDSQICHEIDWFRSSYQPKAKVFIAYDRLAFAGIEDDELRITFDSNLRWRDTDLDLRKGDHGKLILPSDQTLMEIKIPGTAPVWLSHLLSTLGIYATSFSKYGACYKQNFAQDVAIEAEHHITAPAALQHVTVQPKEVPSCA